MNNAAILNAAPDGIWEEELFLLRGYGITWMTTTGWSIIQMRIPNSSAEAYNFMQ